MGFWDDQLVKQLEGLLRKQRKGLEIWRVPNEYGSYSSIMLRIRVLGDTYLDVAEWNERWNAAIVIDTGSGMEPELIDRDMMFLGDYPATGTKRVAQLAAHMLDTFKDAIQDYDPFSPENS
jgi:hypothetical protein